MKLRELLQLLKQVQEKIGTSPPWVCGGVPRDKCMNRLENISDIDITTGDQSVDYLSEIFSDELRKRYNVTRRSMPDGHSSIFVGSLKIDFSSNFNAPNIDELLHQIGIKNPSKMQKEIFSRDFTCNSLLMSLDLKNIIDATKRGFPDIKDRKIKTCLAPEITLTANKNRVVRAIYLACKLDFDVDDSIIEYVSKNPQSVNLSTEKSMAEKLGEAFTRDGDKASFLLTKMGLWNYVPIVKPAYQHYQKHLQGKGNVKK